MLYAISGTDAADSLARRLTARAAHLARVREMQDQGRLVLAGPFPRLDTTDPGDAGFSGSLIIAEFACLADAEAWAGADPYVAMGVWVEVAVRPFIQVVP